jgi:Skp family chaperone for outer membrane proteins
VVLAALAPLGFVLTTPAGQDDSAVPGGKAASRLAVVDLRRVFENDPALKDDIQRIKARGQEEEEKIKKKREEYNGLKLELDAMTDQLNERYVGLASQVVAKEQEIKSYKTYVETWLNREGAELNLKALERYKEVIATIAKGRFDLVFRLTDPEAKDRSMDSRLHAAELSMVLYRAPELDITEDVIQLLKVKK